MTGKLQQLFEAVRRACDATQWSRGVELWRAGRARFERREEEALLFHVAGAGGMAARAVRLFPDDVEWECACSGPDEPCEHVAAAVITWKRTRESGRELSADATPSGRVAYRFSRAEGGLALQRRIVTGERSERLHGSLAARISRVAGRHVVVTQADLAVDVVLGAYHRPVVPRNIVPRLLARLARCSDVVLDGEAVEVSGEPVLPVARLEDHGDGFRLTLGDDPAVTDRFDNGIVLCGKTLRPLGEPGLTGRELHELPRGRYFGPEQVAELVTEVLPSLERRIAVEVRTIRLPQTESVAPRIRIESHAEGERLSVLATLVYGDPVRARIDAGRLMHLGGPVPLRDEGAERRCVRRLERELGLVPGVRAEFEGEEAVAFTRRLSRWHGALVGTAHRAFLLAPPLEARVESRDGRFAVSFASAAGAGENVPGGRADPRRVLDAWRRGAAVVPLLEGGWAPLPRKWLDRHGHRVADLLAACAADGTMPRCALPDLAALHAELDLPPPPALERLRCLIDGFTSLPQAPLPTDLAARLRGYQRDGVNWLAFLREAGLGGLLADDMGLGKTVQALCVLSGRTLVVAPTSVLHNWHAEAVRFRPSLRCCVYHGAQRELDRSADLTLTTYALLRLDAQRLAAEAWDTVVLDEAQAIKNPDSQVAAAAYGLGARFRIALTGTPVENRLDELWSQFHFINRGLLGGRRDFQERYALPIALGDAEAARRLRERIRPFLLRRMKRDVAPELPPRTDVVLHCELEPDERAVYDTIRAATREDVVRALEQGGGVLAALEALLRLRQAACHPALIPGVDAARSSKIELLLESLDSVVAEGHKALVFSQWTSLLDLVEAPLRGAGIDFTRLDGATRDRAAVVRRFQDEDGPPVLLVSLKAGGTGLNLTAADHIFLLDPWWNPAVEDQAADRAHRIGQERPVMVHRLVALGTVEERILELQEHKRELADVALGEAHAAASITRDELLELLR